MKHHHIKHTQLRRHRLEDLVFEPFFEEYIKDLITADVLDKVNREFVTSVLLKENLTEEEQSSIENENMA